MNFVKWLLKELETTPYGLAKKIQASTTAIDRMKDDRETTRDRKISLTLLTRLRLVSGKSWNQLGAVMDTEFLDPEFCEWWEKQGKKLP